MQKQFSNKFSPKYDTHELLREIANFYQLDDESFEDCWSRFSPILYCSEHTCEISHLVSIFYESLNSTTRQLVDMIHEGEFLNSTADESWDYFDLLAEDSQFWIHNMNSEDVNLNAREEKEIELVVLNDFFGNFLHH